MTTYRGSDTLSELLIDAIDNCKNEYYNIAISGGSSPASLFRLWRGEYIERINWSKIRLFWVDERMVPPTDGESNYYNAKRELIEHVPLLSSSVYRIMGENDPAQEADRYSKLTTSLIEIEDGYPIFDAVLLGIGEDGHTSSIFPGQKELLDSKEPFAPSINPYSGQKRVAMTAPAILKGRQLFFYLKGASKLEILEKLKEKGADELYPAAYILERVGFDSIFYDK